MSYEWLTVIALLCQRSIVDNMKYRDSGQLQSECQIKMLNCVEKNQSPDGVSKCIKEGLTK